MYEAPMKSNKRSCEGQKPDGVRCQAAALPDSDFCFFHDPSREIERRAAQAEGGRQNRMKTLNAGAPDINIRACKDVVALLSETINQVRKGLIDPRIANSVGYLANQLVRVLEQNELEDRIEKLEQMLERRNLIPDLMLTGADNAEVTKS
jgi:hypothetical protein